MPNTKVKTATTYSEKTQKTVSNFSSIDPRHKDRVTRFQHLFAWTFTPEKQQSSQLTNAPKIIQDIIAKLPTIDEQIQAVAPEWPLEQMNKIDLSILRITLYEALVTKTPKKVLLNEAIELGKAFGTENSPAFINASLAKILLEEKS